MIEFRTKTYKKKFEVPDTIGEKFKDPVIFYLLNKSDTRKIFHTFVIADFPNKELTYVQSYFPDNVTKLEQHEESKLISIVPIVNPHCSLQIKPKESFYSFMEGANFFLQVDYKKNTMRLYFGKDLVGLSAYGIESFVNTSYKDDKDEEYFYFSARGKKNNDGGCEIFFFRASLDLSDIQNVFQATSTAVRVPHATRKFNEYLFNSEFDATNYKHNRTGKIFENDLQLNRYVFNELFREFCTKTNREYSEEEFKKKNTVTYFPLKIELDPEFKSFCDSKGKDWLDVCKNDEKYTFTALPGSFTMVNLEKKTMDRYYTSFCRAAHFEIDQQKGIIYTSSHNFMRPGTIHYLGPAAIDKFVMKDGILTNVGTFSDPTGYRFTTHRSFYYKGKPYLCAIGHPNRLFFIDAEKMKLVYYDDMFAHVLPDQGNIADFLNLNTPEVVANTFIAFEVSTDGELVFVLGSNYMNIYSFPERKFIVAVPFKQKEPLENGVFLDKFSKNTIHINYLT